MEPIIKIVHFHNGGGGGVLSVIRNLLSFSNRPGVENHIIYTINKATTKKFEFQRVKGAVSEQVFYYSTKWNFYHTCRRLAKLLPDDKAVLVAHDWLELGMADNLGLQNPLVHFVHGNYDYYYDLAKKHQRSTDRFIAVSPVLFNKLCLILPERRLDINYCRFPVPEVGAIKKDNAILKMCYCVRNLNDANKQFKILPLINAKLKSKGLQVAWTIIGSGINKEKIENLMDQTSGILLFQFLTNEEVIDLLPAHDIFILPSLQEGFPVAVVEAMKAGVVPLITNWDGATEELVIHGESGYYFKHGDVENYVNTIAILNADRKLLSHLAENAAKKANKLFDPYVNTKNIEEVIIKAHYADKKQKKPYKAYGSRLDKSWMPNIITNTIRFISK